MSFSDLPKFVLLHLCSFFDLKSHACFSLINKKMFERFSVVRDLYQFLSKTNKNQKLDDTIFILIKQFEKENYPILHSICLDRIGSLK